MRLPGFCRITTLRVSVLCLLAGCGREAGAPPTTALGDVVEWAGAIEMAETPATLFVTPMVAIDPRGGFLVADQREAQIRRYDADGALAWHFGRKGSGPGEFEAPAAAARLPAGQVVAADRSGRLTFLDGSGARVVKTVESGIRRVEDLLVVDDTLVLITGVPGGDPHLPWLHLWSLSSDSVVRSFFTPLADAANRTVSYAAGWVKVARRGEVIAATFSTSDTLYFFTTRGEPAGKLPLAFADFRRGPDQVPGRDANAAERARYMSRFDLVGGVYWLRDGTLLVPYQNVVPERALERRQHLLAVSAGGERRFEARDTPRLLTADAGTSLLYFVHPDAEAPNRWASARLR